MKFLIDRCAGHFLAEWLRNQGHDVLESRDLGPHPGDRVVLEWAHKQARVLITIDTDFGQLIFSERLEHSGLIRLPDVPSVERQHIMEDLLNRFGEEIENGSLITVRGGRIRISKTNI